MIARKIVPLSVRFENSTILVLSSSAIIRITPAPIVEVHFTPEKIQMINA
jgi:hypothetical protein